jgi:hypothetical protein
MEKGKKRQLRTAAKGKVNSGKGWELPAGRVPLVDLRYSFDVLAGKRTTALWIRYGRCRHGWLDAFRMPTGVARVIVVMLLDFGFRVRSLYSDCRRERELLDKRIVRGPLS